MKVFLIEDDDGIAAPLQDFLQQNNCQVIRVSSLLEAEVKEQDHRDSDIILLDWSLPDGEGTDWLRRQRARGMALPVILLTARADLIDKVLGLEFGANDYVTKPFEPRELLARMRAHCRTYTTPDTKTETPSSSLFKIDETSMDVKYKGRCLTLTAMEFKLLLLFVRNPKAVLSRDRILNEVWGLKAPTTRTVDVHVMQLRQKTDAKQFETVHGIGYRYCP